MRYLVNGVITDLPEAEGVTVEKGENRLVVRGTEGTHSALAVRRGEKTLVSYRGHIYEIEKATARGSGHTAIASGEVRSPMPGQIVDVYVQAGQSVTKGEKLMVLEAMKMQQPMTAAFDGKVDRVEVQKGDQVTDGQLLAFLTAGSE